MLMSIILAVTANGLGFILAILVRIGYQSPIKTIRWASRLYIEIFRGLPLILILLIMYLIVGSRRFGIDLSPRAAALTALALYSGAYQAEIVRSGLRSVPRTIRVRKNDISAPYCWFTATIRWRYPI